MPVISDERTRDPQFRLRPLTVDEIRQAVYFESEQAVNFSESELSEARNTAQEYYNGGTRVKSQDGRSAVIVTKTRDTIRQILPSLMRIFLQSTAVVRFLPRTSMEGLAAEQQTDFCNMVFWNNGGYTTLVEGSMNALNKRVGMVRVTYETETVAVHTLKESLTRYEIDAYEDQGYTVTEETRIEEDFEEEPDRASNVHVTRAAAEDTGPAVGLAMHSRDADLDRDPHLDPDVAMAIVQNGEEPAETEEEFEDPDAIYDVVITKHDKRKVWRFDTIPNEEFIIDKYARSIDDAQIIGQRVNKRVSDLVAMGFNYEDVINLTYESTRFQNEKQARQGYTRDEETEDETYIDASARLVLVHDIYMRIDADGDGYAELRHIIAAGLHCKILLDEPANFINYARFVTDIEPHAFFPLSVNEQTWQDSDAQTSLLRAILDNAHLANHPRTVYDPGSANVEDLMNGEIGALIRSTDVTQVQELQTANIGGTTLPIMQYLEQVNEKRTGLVNAFQGSDPDALQSTTRVGVQAMVQGGQSMLEMIARNLAQGVEEIFRLIVRIIVESGDRMVEVRGTDGKFRQFDTSMWHGQMDSEIMVGIGTNQPDDRMAFLTGFATRQEAALQQYGPFNPYAKWRNLRYTYSEMARTAGYKNIQDFWNDVSPQEEAQFLQQMMQQQKDKMGGDSQAQAFLAAEKYKADMKAKTEAQKSQMKMQLDLLKEQAKQGDSFAQFQVEIWKALLEDDLARDEMVAETELEAAKIEGEHRIQIDQLKIQEKQAERDFRNGPTSNGAATN
jgi:hypothetical protein